MPGVAHIAQSLIPSWEFRGPPPHLPLRKTRWVNRQGPWIPGRQLEGSPRKEKAKINDLQGNLEALKSVPSLY